MSVGRFERILDIFFPPKCAFCGSLLPDGEREICAACRRDLPWTENEERKADFIRSVTSPLYYEGKVRSALLWYKFHNAPARGRVYGHLIAAELQKREITDFDVVTWAPLSPKRRRRRGYDQARLMAEAAAEELHAEAVPLLRKIRHVPPQSRLKTAEERRANISGCDAVALPNRVEGKRVLIIDDIITTGSTLSECARMLMLSGAKRSGRPRWPADVSA